MQSVTQPGGRLSGSEELLDQQALRSQLAQALQAQGFHVESPQSLMGKSGVAHNFDLVISKGLSEKPILVDITSSPRDVDEMVVLRCYAKAYDVNLKTMILVAQPRLTESAQKLARLYKIVSLEVEGVSVERLASAIIGIVAEGSNLEG